MACILRLDMLLEKSFCITNYELLTKCHLASCMPPSQRPPAIFWCHYDNTPTQAYVSAHIPLHPDPTAGFQRMKSFWLMRYFAVMVAQVSSFTTKWKVLQFVTMPD
jgi:hypothetical protein